MSNIIFEAKRLKKLAGILNEEIRKISYTAIVLTKESHDRLISLLEEEIPKDWEIIAHHATINMESFAGDPKLLNSNQRLIANSFVKDDKVCAVGIVMPTDILTKNDNPHITIAINKATDVKAKDSNNEKLWENAKIINPIILEGKLVEVAQGEKLFAEDYPVTET